MMHKTKYQSSFLCEVKNADGQSADEIVNVDFSPYIGQNKRVKLELKGMTIMLSKSDFDQLKAKERAIINTPKQVKIDDAQRLGVED